MRKSRFNEEQIIKTPKEREAGAKLADICRRDGISEPTFYSCKAIALEPEVAADIFVVPN